MKIPVKWSVETSRAECRTIEAFHGETLALEADLQSYGKPLAPDAQDVAQVFWQKPGMGDTWWSAPATIEGSRLRADFTPAMDPGEPTLVGFLGIPGAAYRAAFTLRFRNAPGKVPNEITYPPKVIDFAEVETRNEAWFAPVSVLTVASGDTLQPSTIGRFTATDSSEVGFTLADPPAGRMAEYEVWVDCASAAPAAVSFRLADPAKVIDPRVEGTVRVMAVGKTYIYRVQAFENPDANHVSFTVFQQLANGLSKVPDLDWLYAPNTAMEIDTSKLTGRTFVLNIVAIGETRSVTVYWGDGSETTADCRTDRRTAFAHTYARSGTFVVQVSDVDVNIQSGTASGIVRACRWGDSITNGWATFQDCKNLVGPVPRWGKSMETGQSAFQGCSALTGTIPAWGEKMVKCSGAFQSCSKLTGIWNTGATTEEIMPSRMVEHSGVVTGCSSTVRSYFTTTWGGTKTA